MIWTTVLSPFSARVTVCAGGDSKEETLRILGGPKGCKSKAVCVISFPCH